MIKNSVFDLLQKWYLSQCDGDWEHGSSIHIETSDNPGGWSIKINIEGTELEDKFLEPYEIRRSENDWFSCCVQENLFEARCGPLNLTEVLQFFLRWAASNS